MEPFFPGFLSDRLLDRNFVVRNVDKKKANGIYFFLFLRYLCFCARFLNHSAAVMMLCALYFIFCPPPRKEWEESNLLAFLGWFGGEYIYFLGESGMGSNPLAFLEGCDVSYQRKKMRRNYSK